MALLVLYWGIMIACYIIASKLRANAYKFAFVEELLNIVIYVLVLIMGLRMGANEEVTSSLGTIGVQSVGITFFTVAGSMLAVFFVRKAMGLNREGVLPIAKEQGKEEVLAEAEAGIIAEEEAKQEGGMKTTLTILGFVVAGMLGGYFLVPRIFADIDAFQEVSSDLLIVGICVLLGLVGFNLGLSGQVFESFKDVGIKVIFIPIAAVAGSLAMGLVYGIFSSLSAGEAVAISAGFGWYTMAPGLITEAGFAVAGAVSFMHNVIRETLGIVIIPLVAKKIGYLEAISIPGVAAMDVCLPIVEKSCRPETVVYSFCTGALMCIAVPLIVPLALG